MLMDIGKVRIVSSTHFSRGTSFVNMVGPNYDHGDQKGEIPVIVGNSGVFSLRHSIHLHFFSKPPCYIIFEGPSDVTYILEIICRCTALSILIIGFRDAFSSAFKKNSCIVPFK